MDFVPSEKIDELFDWPLGKAERLARQGKLPHYVLPDGKSIRFRQQEIEALVRHHVPRGDKLQT